MVRLLQFLGYLVFFIGALVFFMPKVSLYHYAEKELEKHKVILSKEEVLDKGLSLNLNHVSVSYDSIVVADVASADLTLLVLHNSIHIENIQLSEMASSFVPVKVDAVDVKYSILNPLYITATGFGEFGEVSAEVHILDRNATLVLVPSELMLKKYKKTLTMLKKNEKGSYEYAKNF